MLTLARAWTDDALTEWDREARTYGPDEDSDDDGETDESPTVEVEVEVPVIVDMTGRLNLEPYPDGWLTLPQWEFIAAVAAEFGSPNMEYTGASVWVPIEEWRVRSWALFADALAAGCTLFQPVFRAEVGTWIDTTPLGA